MPMPEERTRGVPFVCMALAECRAEETDLTDHVSIVARVGYGRDTRPQVPDRADYSASRCLAGTLAIAGLRLARVRTIARMRREGGGDRAGDTGHPTRSARHRAGRITGLVVRRR
jgi:hypothetical protein